MWISPEQLVTEYIERLIRYPGALQVLDFADGRVRLVGMRARKGGLLVGQQLRTLREHMPERRGARRGDLPRRPQHRARTATPSSRKATRCSSSPRATTSARDERDAQAPRTRCASVVIAGGGNIGFRLARTLEKHIPGEADRARRASARAGSPSSCDSTIVLHGDAADEELLIEENIDSADVFAALTNSEEANILSAMLAKRLGARKVMALINRPAYARADGEPAASTSRSRRRPSPSARCWRTCAAATWCACTRCAAARPRRSRPSRTAAAASRAWSAGAVEDIQLPEGATIVAHRARRRR